MPPIIGILAKHAPQDKALTDTLIVDEIKQAVYTNGGIPVGIMPAEKEIIYCRDNWRAFEHLLDKENFTRAIDVCDGLILQGGVKNEACEPFAAAYCYEHNIPCLGICAGQNSIVRGVDGTTQELSEPHRHNNPSAEYVHGITVREGTLFYKITGKTRMPVNSRHKRTVDDTKGLVVSAVCEDGWADVIEAPDRDFFMGVRFHPESLYEKDESMNEIFRYFISVCEKRREKNG